MIFTAVIIIFLPSILLKRNNAMKIEHYQKKVENWPDKQAANTFQPKSV